jgi:hypothetical protein
VSSHQPVDAVGSVAFHPFKSILLSASGSRHFLDDEDEVEADDDSEDGLSSGEEGRGRLKLRRPRPVMLDSTMKIWDLREQSTLKIAGVTLLEIAV